MIESKHLKLIVEFAEVGSLSKAAKRLNLSQSALSHQLKNLEEYLGVKVFHRVDNQLLFTEVGKELRDRARLIINQHEDLESHINELKLSEASKYIHGYSLSEAQRLLDQATSVAEFLHYDSFWEEGSRILEVGCGVGAQTEILANQNPNSKIISIDISKSSLKIAKAKIEKKDLTNVEFRHQDARDFQLKNEPKFDAIFICFLLEHLKDPHSVLNNLKSVIKDRGTITVVEGDHGSTFFHPDNDAASKVVQAQVDLQQKKGGNANVGRELYPLLDQTGYQDIEVSPRQIYVDESKPELVKGFIENTFTAMIKGVAEDIITHGILSATEVEDGIDGLMETTKSGGTFSYTFFKAKAIAISSM